MRVQVQDLELAERLDERADGALQRAVRSVAGGFARVRLRRDEVTFGPVKNSVVKVR